jgi:hypothetical protein
MRFPVKGTVFAVLFLLINVIFVYLQPARAENTVTFKMVILPAEEGIVENAHVDSISRNLMICRFKNPNISIVFLEEFWKIYNIPQDVETNIFNENLIVYSVLNM